MIDFSQFSIPENKMDVRSRPRFKVILEYYMNIINSDVDEIANKTKTLKLPHIPPQFLKDLINEATEIFKNENMIIKVPVPTVVVGDLHGHILDLFRVIRHFHLPPMKNYLFLGDFVDRGEFSCETITLVLTLKVLFPNRVFIIRGNHEFAEMCNYCGFMYELEDIYGTPDIGEAFLHCFSYMPLAASIDDYALAVHGGVGEVFTNMSQLDAIPRPIDTFDEIVVGEALWSDPSETTDTTEPSPRGLGCLFGSGCLRTFLATNHHSILIRGHQCVEEGVEKGLDGQIITVFGASKYCDAFNNKAGVLLVKPGKKHDIFTFPPYPYLRRCEVTMLPVDIHMAIEAPVFAPSKKILVKPTNAAASSTPQLPYIPPRRMSMVRSEHPKPATPHNPLAPQSKSARVRVNRLFELSCVNKQHGVATEPSYQARRRVGQVHEPERITSGRNSNRK